MIVLNIIQNAGVLLRDDGRWHSRGTGVDSREDRSSGNFAPNSVVKTDTIYLYSSYVRYPFLAH